MTIIRIHTDSIENTLVLADAMKTCIHLKLAFYYSGRQHVIRIETRSRNRALQFEREMALLGVGTTKSYY